MRGYASYFSLDASWLHFYPVGNGSSYVWIFPMSAELANVGAWLTADTWHRLGGRGERVWATMWAQVPEAGAAIAAGPESIAFQTYPTVTLLPAQVPCGERWMCIGGAAGLVHAATGEGISYALWSGIEAANWIVEGGLPGADATAAIQKKCAKEIGIYYAD
jgi:flavin-dependent dehydrogenase